MKTQIIETTDQMIFDATVLHLMSQRAKSANNNTCLYRGPNGMRCAVGFHITDEEYHPTMEGIGIGGHDGDRVLPKRLRKHSSLLSQLQYAHDVWIVDHGLQDLKTRLELVARSFGLSSRVLATSEV